MKAQLSYIIHFLGGVLTMEFVIPEKLDSKVETSSCSRFYERNERIRRKLDEEEFKLRYDLSQECIDRQLGAPFF